MDGTFAVTRRLAAIIALTAVLFTTGCGLDLGHMQANMDRMVCYMGAMSSTMPMMVQSTQRLANNADEMQRKADGLIREMRDKGKSSERTAFNFLQAFHDNDKAMVRSLEGIRKELGTIKESLGTQTQTETQTSSRSKDDENNHLQAKLKYLEARLEALTAKVDKIDKNASADLPRR